MSLADKRTDKHGVSFQFLFERTKITGHKCCLRCLVTSEYLILFTRQLQGETVPSVKVWLH